MLPPKNVKVWPKQKSKTMECCCYCEFQFVINNDNKNNYNYNKTVNNIGNGSRQRKKHIFSISFTHRSIAINHSNVYLYVSRLDVLSLIYHVSCLLAFCFTWHNGQIGLLVALPLLCISAYYLRVCVCAAAYCFFFTINNNNFMPTNTCS